MVDSEKLIAALETILRERGLDLEEWMTEWDRDAGTEPGRTKQILVPDDGRVQNRNVRLVADRLGISGSQFYERIISIKDE